VKTLFEQDLKVVNVGLQGFASNIAAAGGKVTHLSCRRPRAPTPRSGGRWRT